MQLLGSGDKLKEQSKNHAAVLQAAENERKQLKYALQSQKEQQLAASALSGEQHEALLAEREKQLREFYLRVAPDNAEKASELAAASVTDIAGVRRSLQEAYESVPEGWNDIQQAADVTLATDGATADTAAREQALKQKMEQLMMAALQKQQKQYRTEKKLADAILAKLQTECNGLKGDVARVSSLIPGASEDAITNVSYLKNVVVQYMCSPDQNGRRVLWPVIATLLHLTPEEIGKVRDAIEPKGIYALFS